MKDLRLMKSLHEEEQEHDHEEQHQDHEADEDEEEDQHYRHEAITKEMTGRSADRDNEHGIEVIDITRISPEGRHRKLANRPM